MCPSCEYLVKMVAGGRFSSCYAPVLALHGLNFPVFGKSGALDGYLQCSASQQFPIS